MPEVSVIIPAYNAEESLGRALDSVLAQSFSDYEILVVDDGSTDATAEVARSRPEVRLFEQENRGQAAARNVGIREAKGAYLAFLDADDAWLPEKLRRQLEFMAKKRSQISFTDTFYERNDVRRRYSEIAPPAEGEILIPLLHQSFITTNTVVVKRELLAKAGGFSEDPSYRQHEDYELWLRLAAGGARFDYLDEPLAVYYAGHESSSSDEVRMYQSFVKSLETFRGRAALSGEPDRIAQESIWALKVAAANALFRRRRFQEAAAAWREIPGLSWRRRLKYWASALLSSLSRG